MAVTQSGTFGLTWRDALKQTIVLDLDATTHKAALFVSTITPNFDTDTAYGVATFAAGEVSGTGYTVGGMLIGSPPTVVVSSSLVVWSCPDFTWSTVTLTDVRALLIYADALAGNNAIGMWDLGTSLNPVGDNIAIHVPGTGLVTWDYS